MSIAVFAQGTLFQLGDGASPENFTTIAEARSIAGPSQSRDTLDVTNHSSPNRAREFLSGLKDGGEVTFTVGWNPSEPTHGGASGLVKWYNTDTPKNFRIVFVNSLGRWDCAGICTGLTMTYPIDEVMTADTTIKVTGLPSLI